MLQSLARGAPVLAVALAAGPPGAATASPTTDAPERVRVGEAVSVSVTGLKPDVVYRLSLEPPATSHKEKTVCERNVDQPFHVGRSDRTYVFRGRVPSTLRCGRRGGNATSKVISLRPGKYRWVIGRKTGHGTWDRSASLVVARVEVRHG